MANICLKRRIWARFVAISIVAKRHQPVVINFCNCLSVFRPFYFLPTGYGHLWTRQLKRLVAKWLLVRAILSTTSKPSAANWPLNCRLTSSPIHLSPCRITIKWFQVSFPSLYVPLFCIPFFVCMQGNLKLIQNRKQSTSVCSMEMSVYYFSIFSLSLLSE